jgi:hypothetical protein
MKHSDSYHCLRLFNVGRLISRGSMVWIAADILVDREDAIAYKQLGRRPEDPTMAPVL